VKYLFLKDLDHTVVSVMTATIFKTRIKAITYPKLALFTKFFSCSDK